MKSAWAVSLALLLPLTSVAYPFTHAPISKPEPQASVVSELVGSKVVVRLHDGRVFEGTLVELTNDFVRIQTDKGKETIPVGELASVDRRRKRRWLLPVVIGVAALAVVGMVVGAAVTGEGD